MIWIKKINKFIRSMDKKDWWLFVLALFAILDTISLITASSQLTATKKQFAEFKDNYRADLINELCNDGQGNYDFCILKKAEYTFVEKDKNPTVKPVTKNKEIEELITHEQEEYIDD